MVRGFICWYVGRNVCGVAIHLEKDRRKGEGAGEGAGGVSNPQVGRAGKREREGTRERSLMPALIGTLPPELNIYDQPEPALMCHLTVPFPIHRPTFPHPLKGIWHKRCGRAARRQGDGQDQRDGGE